MIKILNFKENLPGVQTVVKSQVSYAIKTGALVRPEVCSSCDCICQAQAHHHDYEKPLEVEWLCQGCHSVANKKRANQQRIDDGKEESRE